MMSENAKPNLNLGWSRRLVLTVRSIGGVGFMLNETLKVGVSLVRKTLEAGGILEYSEIKTLKSDLKSEVVSTSLVTWTGFKANI
jgi:hypothetical protein